MIFLLAMPWLVTVIRTSRSVSTGLETTDPGLQDCKLQTSWVPLVSFSVYFVETCGAAHGSTHSKQKDLAFVRLLAVPTASMRPGKRCIHGSH